jgi:hypothetical protein
LVVTFSDEYRSLRDVVALSCINILQNAVTTASAIALLLRHGYVVDAEARWRGLHELACTAAVLSDVTDPQETATRYLAHGRRLPDDHPAYSEPWATHPRFSKQYEWLRGELPGWKEKRKIEQAWLFEQASLASAPFDDWLKPSHGPVHMSSIAVTVGSAQAGAAPAGYDEYWSDHIAWQAACSLYELVAHLCHLMTYAGLPREEALAWSVAFRSAAEQVRRELIPRDRMRWDTT